MDNTRTAANSIIASLCYHLVAGSFFVWGAVADYAAAYFAIQGYTHSYPVYLLFVPIRGIAHFLARPCRRTMEDCFGPGSYEGLSTFSDSAWGVGGGCFFLLTMAAIVFGEPVSFVVLFAAAFGVLSGLSVFGMLLRIGRAFRQRADPQPDITPR